MIAINPLAERGFTNFVAPKDILHTTLGKGHAVAHAVYRVNIGGDLALFKGVAKRLLEMQQAGHEVLDRAFIEAHCSGFDAWREDLAKESWAPIVEKSGIPRAQIDEIAALYTRSNATMATWCMGITHHEDAVATIQTIVNLLLLKGNIGKPGAGAVPVRGHSNVQGDRTMGCTYKVSDGWLDNMTNAFPGVRLSRADGL
ncbi:MAG TPA: CbbBc protein, partial [Rhodocyclaceae bacterium]|nr:CbbBc protein [Rhodocyclaceae bacterium]